MSYKVPLITTKNAPLRVKGKGRVCLGHIARLLHLSAVERPGGDFSELLSSAREQFETLDDFSPPSGDLPPFNRSAHFRFRGIGSWRAANIVGILEVLHQDDQFVQAGFQVRCKPVLVFGARKAYQRALYDLCAAAAESYSEDPAPSSLGGRTTLHFSDDATFAYLSSDQDDKILTYRIGNRAVWDSET